MLIAIGEAISEIFYDAFVAKFDFWLLFGILAQLTFAARFLVQWIASERAKASVVPLSFWFLSIAGGMMTLVYGLVKREPVIIMGQALSVFIYLRNVMLIFRGRGAGAGG
jgi:lipid-A-disaccharide synthase-like uncharacterized protein